MRYKKFEIKNFKGITEHIVLDLRTLPPSNIFTLVGLNESGKTSILEAIDLLQNRQPDEKAHEMIHKSKKGNFNGSISIEATLELNEEDEDRIAEFCKTNFSFSLTKKIGEIKICKKYNFKDSKFVSFESLWTLPLHGKKPRAKNSVDLHDKYEEDWNKVVGFIEDNFPKILYYQDFLFRFPQRIYLEDDDALKDDEREYRKVLQDVLDSFNDNLTIEKHLLARLNSPSSENDESLESLMGDIAQKLTDTIFDNWGEVFLKDSKEIELKYAKDATKGHYIQLKVKQGKDRFSIDERSLGFRWFFSFLLFTEFRKERKADFGETLFLLDEPANNLHQKSQMKLLDVFDKLSRKCKIIYSTHSHYLINPRYLAGTYVVKNKAINYDEEENFDQNETNISATLYKNFVSKYPNEKDHYKPILDAIDYVPSNFDLVEKIVCLEGRNDYYTFGYFQDVIFRKYNYNFYPGASVDKYDDLFRLYIAWNKPLLAVFDADSQGVKAKRRYANEISEELSSCIYTLDEVDTSWKNFSTEDLFSDDDRVAVIQTLFENETSYSKSKFNTAMQALYINKEKVTLSDGTKKNFKKVLEFMGKKI